MVSSGVRRLRFKILSMTQPSSVIRSHRSSPLSVCKLTVQFSLIQSLSCVQLFVTPRTAAHQASVSFTSSGACSNLMSIESMRPSNCLLLCRPLLLLQSFPASGSFPMSQLFTSGGQSTGASASVLPVNIQGCLPLGLTGWISLLSKGLSRVFCNTTV